MPDPFDIPEEAIEGPIETSLRNVLDASPIGIAILDQQNGNRLMVNQALVEMFGAESKDELLHGDISKTWVDPSRLADAWSKFQNKEVLVNFEAERRRLDGSRLWVLMNSQPIVFDGLDAGAVWHVDITERKLAEKKLQDAYSTISESINYASNIQRSVLTEEKVLAAATREHLMLWEPRDVVGGDICWCHTWGDGTLVTLADCTGHGVPGAFMTLIATGALDRAMNEVLPGDVGQLIQRMHQIVQTTLSQGSDGGDSDDGLELGACYMEPDWGRLTFASARLPLFVVEGGEVIEVRGGRQGIGYRGIPQRQDYEETKITLRDGITFYMTTDGYLEQVGGEQRRMFGKKRFKELLLSLDGKPLTQQKKALHSALFDYQGEERRRDDVSMVAFRI